MSDKSIELDVGVLTGPSSDTIDCRPVIQFVELLDPLVENVYLAAGGRSLEESSVPDSRSIYLIDSRPTGIDWLDYMTLQVHICIRIFGMLSEVDVVFLHKKTMGYLLPALLLRLTGTTFCATKIGAYSIERSKDPSLYDWALYVLQYGTFYLSDAVIVLGKNEVNTVPNNSVFVTLVRMVDLDTFDSERRVDDREYDLGYVGRFDKEKNVTALAEAITLTKQEDSSITACFIGDGRLKEEVVQTLPESPDIKWHGWVDYDELPGYYKQMKILLVPSLGEGLPTTIIEAMGSGTLVAATPVGSIPSIVSDGETGFLIDHPTSDGIKRTIERVLDREDLDEISAKGRMLVRGRFSENQIRENLREVLVTLGND